MRGVSIEASAILALISHALAASEPSRPRGVGPEFAKFYKAAEAFTCIASPSIQLKVEQVNDDYCDCPDGSDEPGTSACSYLSPLSPPVPLGATGDDSNTTNALPGFYCKNKGHIPGYIPFTNVNDGVCDYEQCCDGSDEFEGLGGVKCEDRCKEIGKQWRKLDEQRQLSLNTANKKRKELTTEAARLRKEVEDRIQTLGTEIEGAEIKVAQLEKDLAEIERTERSKVVRSSGKGGKYGVLIGLAKDRIQDLRDYLSRVREERDSSKSRVKELEDILSTFKEEYNPNFNDEGVKRAVRAWEDYAARDKGPDGDAAHDRDLDELLKPDSETGINWAEWEEDNDDDTDVLYKFEEYLPALVRDWVDQKLRDLRLALIDNGIMADPSTDGSESQAVTDARSRKKSADDDLTRLQQELSGKKDDLTKDYGPDDVFRALKGRCVSQDSGEYTYEMCFLEKTTQKPKKGGANTGMGNFKHMETVIVDEEVPADGKGVGSGERIAMKYENGQHCWNGPNRSTMVILTCAENDEIWKVVEEEKCVYRMEIGTPAVCEGATSGRAAPVKDEL